MNIRYFTFGSNHVASFPRPEGSRLADYWVEVVLPEGRCDHRTAFVEFFASKYCPSSMQFAFEYTAEEFEPSYFPKGVLTRIQVVVDAEMVNDALRLSIAKWERNADPNTPMLGKTHGTRECALCDLFHKSHCKGCPIAEKTGGIVCQRTPYISAIDAHYDWLNSPNEGNLEAYHRAAQEEVDFLKSLLPEEE